MNLNYYQEFTKALNVEPTFEHLMPAFIEEVGEAMGHLKRYYRDNKPIDKEAVKKEMGDILWCWSEMNRLFGFSSQEVLDANVDKLKDRLERNMIQGSGDNR